MATMPRAVAMDDEYVKAMLSAELAWVDGVVADLASGALTWSKEELEPFAGPSMPDGELALRLPSRQSPN